MATSASPIGLGNGLNTPPGTLGEQTLSALLAGPFIPLPISGAIPQTPTVQGMRTPGKYVITKAGVAALTLNAPIAGADDGVLIQVISTTANAHTITSTNNIQDGNSSGNKSVLTFGAHIGANVILEAYNGVWYAVSEVNVSITA